MHQLDTYDREDYIKDLLSEHDSIRLLLFQDLPKNSHAQ